jgi:hypothetical protein
MVQGGVKLANFCQLYANLTPTFCNPPKYKNTSLLTLFE